MGGGGRLLFIFAFALLMVGAVYASDDAKAPADTRAAAGPPKAEPRPVEEYFHGTKIIDKYRWLEDGGNTDTQKWVAEEMAYTRGVLDPLAGREAIHKRLTELLSIGSISVPQIGGKYYFYTRREGMQNQPVLYVREGVD